MILIGLLLNGIYLPMLPTYPTTTTDRDGYANIYYWDGGVMVWAHNGLSGGMFYDIDSVTGFYSDGHTQRFEAGAAEIYMLDSNQWMQALTANSDPNSVTLVTCYPPTGQAGRLIIELKPQRNYDDCIRYSSQSC